MAKKKFLDDISITDFTFPNFGIGFFEDNKVKIKNAIPGQKIQACISKKRRCYEGKVLEVLEKSPNEIEALCEDFSMCGGCTFQNISYDYEIDLKRKMVKDILENEGIGSFENLEVVSGNYTDGYRNKMEYSFGDNEKGGSLALGMRKRNSFYEVVTSKKCNIVDSDFRSILKTTLDFFQNSEENFYHKSTLEGSLRHLLVRKGYFTGEILVSLITNDTLKTDLNIFKEKLLKINTLGKIVSISHTINNSLSDIVSCDSFNILYGQDFFYENILSLKFKISTFSFFQTNSIGAEKLYSTVKEFAGDVFDKVVFDLYCGTGTIAQIMSKGAKSVFGIELVAEAVDAANENSKLNNINNCTFLTGDVLKIIDELTTKPDIIILDPPRDGIHPKALDKIINFGVEKIVYVSCKPTSLARDLKVFISAGYNILNIRCHDMFPRTYHIETVVLLSK